MVSSAFVAPGGRRSNRLRAWARTRLPGNALTLGVLAALAVLVVAPLWRLVTEANSADGVWSEVLTSDLAPNLFWEPLRNTAVIGFATGFAAVVIGTTLAWFVVMTDVPGRHVIGVLATIPFALPSFGLALAWESAFRNERLGSGRVGLLETLGVSVPDWLAWGWLPVTATLVAHYYPLVFLLAAAALSSVRADVVEAASLTGAGRLRVALGITLPVIRPALLSGFLLAFAEAVSNFAAPALLGLPVRYHTISTRIFGMYSTGRVERAYALAVLLVALAGSLISVNTFLTRRKAAFQTLTGKGARRQRILLGRWRWPAFGALAATVTASTIVPGVLLLASTFTRRTGSFAGGFTTHFWIGESDPSIAQGQAGVLRNDQLLDALWTTLRLGGAVAITSTVLGLAIGFVTTRRSGHVTTVIGVLSYVPFLIPGLAFGAAFTVLFSGGWGPLPSLQGTFALLAIAGTAITLPFSARAGASAMSQVGNELEEAASLTGASFLRRLWSIMVPLTIRGLVAGALLSFVKMIRDLSMVVLLATPTLTVLTVIAFRYASDGFTQLANATLVIVTGISVIATVAANRLERASQPWNEEP